MVLRSRMGRKPVERTIYMDTLDLIQKMRGELDALEAKLATVKGHVREERFENKEFANGIGRFEDFVLSRGIRLEESGRIEGDVKGTTIWDYLAKIPQGTSEKMIGVDGLSLKN